MTRRTAAVPNQPEMHFRISGMDCAGCATKVERAVRRIDGVTDAEVSASAGTLRIKTTSESAALETVQTAVRRLGYGIAQIRRDGLPVSAVNTDHVGDHSSHDGHDHAASIDGPWWRSRKAKLTLACAAALAIAYLFAKLVPAFGGPAFVAAMAIGLVPIAQRAYRAARVGSPFTIETLMSIAAVGAVFIGAAEEAAMVVLLFLIGEMLEGVAAGRARASIQGLASLVPKTALLEHNGATREVPANSLAIGAVILVRPGDRIPADGIVVSGESAVDEAPVTGESTPKRKSPNDSVFAGTINTDTALRVRVTAAASDNTIARVIRLVEHAQASKAPTERFIDRFSRWYTPAVLALGGAVAILPPLLFGAPWQPWIYKGLAILLIGCPCALVISVPAAIAAGLASGAKRGLLLKGGSVLETIGKVTIVAFDKTGTLTEGRPRVTDIISAGRSERDVLATAAALEIGSNHPLARAILARAAVDEVAPLVATDLAALGGKGVAGRIDGHDVLLASAKAAAAQGADLSMVWASIERLNDEGKSVSILVIDRTLAGLIAMRDEPRADAKVGIDSLNSMAVSSVMLTGDNRRTGEAVARSLGIQSHTELLPEDKQHIVRELKAAGHRIAKVGDGINDAPALAEADVGIAMGGGTDVALETGDAAVLHGRVTDVAAMIDLSRKTMVNIRTNIAISLGLKAVFLVTTLLGVTGLWPAILADTGATVLVTMNALRLLGTTYSPYTSGATTGTQSSPSPEALLLTSTDDSRK